MKARRPRADFMLSRETLEAAAALGRWSDVAAAKAMHSAASRRAIRERQYRAVMLQKARPADETTSGDGATQESSEARLTQKETEKMDAREFIGGTFLKPEDIGSTPIVLTITNVAEGKYDKLDLTFDDESKLSLNNTNGKTIAKTWGYETSAWIRKQVELRVGTTTFKGEPQETILLRPISPATPAGERALAKPTKPDISDDIPF
jgi:hypothetical protein